MIERAGPSGLHARGAHLQRPAIALYERFGFRSAGTRPRYYHDTGEDAVIMWRTDRAETTRPGRSGMILALETSCDDTCAAVITAGGEIRSNVISSQGVHDRYGGVVPEIASRHHLELIGAVVDDALARAGATLADVELVAVTRGPGWSARCWSGLATAKALAAAHELPLAAVDHLHGHIAAGFLAPDPSSRRS